MAHLCSEQYDHPVLWCDGRRLQEEKRIAEEGLSLVQQRREQNQLKKHREANEVSLCGTGGLN